MACLCPVSIRDANHETLAVPCGKCHHCRLARVRAWVFRIEEERKHHVHAWFCTMTYDKTFKSPNGLSTLDKSHFQKFLKRLRKLSTYDVKYLAVGEYGSIRRRPHYHAIILGAITDDDIIRTWEQYSPLDYTPGYCQAVPVLGTGATAYVVKYMDKGRVIPMWDTDDRVPEFCLMSKRMGSRYLTPEMVAWHRTADDGWSVQSGADIIPMPRYHKQKVFGRVIDPNTGLLIVDYGELLELQHLRFISKMEDRYERNWRSHGSELDYIKHMHASEWSSQESRRLYNQTKCRMDL